MYLSICLKVKRYGNHGLLSLEPDLGWIENLEGFDKLALENTVIQKDGLDKPVPTELFKYLSKFNGLYPQIPWVRASILVNSMNTSSNATAMYSLTPFLINSHH